MNNNNKKLREYYGDYLRIISIIAVILIHITGTVVVNYFNNPQWWWLANILNSFCRWSVPIMVMVSGAFIIEKAAAQSPVAFWKKNILKIFIPLLFWSIIYYIIISSLNNDIISIKDFFKKFFNEEINYTLWFMYMIIQLYLICPMIAPVITTCKKNVIEIILIFWGISVFLINLISNLDIYKIKNFDVFSGYNSYLGYMILGYFLSKYSVSKIKRYFIYFGGVLGIFVTLVGNFIFTKNNNGIFNGFFYSNLSLNVLITSIAIFLFFKNLYYKKMYKFPKFNEACYFLSSLTYGIYLIHDLILRILSSGKLKVIIAFFGTFNPYIGIPITLVIAFILSAFITFIFKKTFLKRFV